MLHPRFLYREMIQARRQAFIFILCVALSITSLVALNSFKRDVNTSITGDARALHGGDIILHSHYDFSSGLLAAVAGLQDSLTAKARTWEFYSVVRSPDEENTLLSNIMAVESGYPLYGEVELASGAEFASRLQPGKVVVAQELLGRLQLRVGDSLKVGRASLEIADTVIRESSRPVEMLNFGPRVFVNAVDLPGLDLVKTGSRVFYGMVLAVPGEGDMEAAVGTLKSAAVTGQERVSSYRTARSGLKRFFDNLLFFLSLISVFTLLLAGIGMQSSLSALLRQKEKSLAITRALGATQRFIFSHYLLLVLIFGFIGSFFGVAAGFIMKYLFPALFHGLVDAQDIGPLRFSDIGEGMMLGFLVVCFFTFLPLYRLREVKPSAIFRSESGESPKTLIYYLSLVAGCIFLTLVVIRQLEDVLIGMYFVAASVSLILVVSIFARMLLMLVNRLPIRHLGLRQAISSLLRPGNSTRPIIVTLASALSVLLAIFLVEYNLHSTYVESYPADAPNVFMVDVQKDQRAGVYDLVGSELELHPIIRARLKAINGEAVSRPEKQQRFSDSLTREFNLTYREELLPDEQLKLGDSLYQKDAGGSIFLQVSVLDMVAEMGDMQLGDILDFNIQGVPLRAEITSIRTRNKSMLYPFFYFIFPPEYLQEAPQTFFAAMHVPQQQIPALQARLVEAYPNISVINMAKTATELGVVMQRLSGIVNFFALFSILAGALIIISSVLATRLARIQEAVYYKILGGKSSFVFSVFLYENMLLGLFSSLLAILLAQGGSWALCKYLFEIEYNPYWPASGILVVLTIAIVVGVGMLSSVTIIRQKPATFLREQTSE